MREQANLLPPGRIRDELLRKARQAEAAAQADEWANSSGAVPMLVAVHERLMRERHSPPSSFSEPQVASGRDPQ
jgi:hypothetical protein